MSRSTSTPSSSSLGRRAVVLGASMAGLLAGRVLAECFDEVWLLERDGLADAPEARKGTPHALHAHGLLARGREILETLFPGFTAALAARGAMVGDLQLNAPFVAGGRRFAQGRCGRQGLACSRLAIEAEVRRRVRALPNVKVITDVDIVQPVLDDGRITGVRIVRRVSGGEETLAADLVVDCTGRGSRLPGWLREWGFDAPDEERVAVGIGYVTTYLRREPEQAPDIAAMIFAATPELPLPGVLLAQEAEADGVPRWVATVGSYAGDGLPATIEAMRERARRMGDPTFARVLQESEPIGPVLRYGFAHSQRRRFERLAAFPERLLAMGDAIASFNPVYGQGMSVAACQALALQRSLRHGLAGVHRRYFRAAAKAVDVPWQLAVGADLAIPSVPGEPAARRCASSMPTWRACSAPRRATRRSRSPS